MSSSLDFLHDVRARWRSRGWRRGRANVPSELDRRGAERIRRQLRALVDEQASEGSVREHAAELATAYLALGEAGRLGVVSMIAAELATPEERAVEAARRIVEAESAEARTAAIHAARAALGAPWLTLLTRFNTLPDGVKLLVDLRADVLAFAREHPELRPLERDLKQLLASWFDVGFLELQRVTWDSPASLLEKLSRSEAVHAVTGWDDLKNRLEPDRRFFAFFHPRMPGEPLIFVQVALVQGLATEIGPLLDPEAPLVDPAAADTAVFYSISSVQPGLHGISFGGFLIKQVVDRLRVELPQLKRFATLSPIPGLREWLSHRDLPEELRALVAAPAPPPEALKTALLQLGAHYLLGARRRDGRALDPVANFHLTNGARVERLDWLADTSPAGVEQSLSLMVNYLYRLEEIDANHEAYVGERKIVASSAVEQLARAGAKLVHR
jgi:malonyl-CoA decarboxylase